MKIFLCIDVIFDRNFDVKLSFFSPIQGIEMKDVRRPSVSSLENALLNVAQSQISTSMTKLNHRDEKDEVSDWKVVIWLTIPL